jgi:predicted secreted hydrolase
MMGRAAFLGVTLAALTAAASAAPPPGPGVLPGGDAPGFAQALAPRLLAFPRDHGPHSEFRQEWWYLTGNLEAAGGERYGFELTFFRFALAPPAAGADTGTAATSAPNRSAWRTREIYMAHFAITDVAAQRFRFAQKLSRAALALAGAQAAPLRVWIDDWVLDEAPSQPLWRLRAAQPGYALELELRPLTPVVLNGEAGWSRKSDTPGSASYYYSIPRLEARGRLLRDGRPLTVRGLAWFDREWGSGGLSAGQTGWDWFALQLDDGSALMFYALRDRGGGRDSHSAGTWVESSGESQRLPAGAVDIEATDHWTNPEGVRYPAGWHIRVPTLALDVKVRPLLADQELKTAPRYWEGAVDVDGERAGRTVRGRGYVELVGYARER